MAVCHNRGFLFSAALLCLAITKAQAAAVNVVITGEIERITLNNPGDVWSGGRMVVGGHEVIIPRNLLMDFPANRLTLQQTFAGAPPACVSRGQSGLAKGDSCNSSGTGGYASITANRTNAGDVIAGDVFLQKATEVETGVVTFMNFTDGYFRLNGTPNSSTTGVMVRLNDPSGRHTHQQGLGCAGGGQNCSPDPRFNVDPDNYTSVFSTGYPVCLPSTVPRSFTDVLDFNNNGNRNEVLTAQSTNTGTGDLLCPDTNRVVTPPHAAADSRRLAPIQMGDHLTVQGNFEIVNGVRFFSAWGTKVSRNVTTRNAPGQPDYMFLDEVSVDGPAFERARIRSLFIGHATQDPPDVVIWSLHRDPANGVHEFPMASVVGCDAAAGVGTCANVLGPNSFRVKHDVDFLQAKPTKPDLDPCAHLRSDPRFANNNICPGGSTISEQFTILSPIPHEIQGRTGAKIADLARGGAPLLRTLDVHGTEASNGQYLFPFGLNLGGIELTTFAELDPDKLDRAVPLSGIPWNLDRRLSPGGCNGICESTPQPLDPFPFEDYDPRTQGPLPNTTISDPNFTSSPLTFLRNRLLSFVSPNTGNFNGNQTVLSWPPADPGSQGINVTPTLPGGGVFVPPIPQLGAITPAAGVQGATISVSLTGINLTGGTGPIIGAIPGITVTITSAGPSQLIATFAIAANAALGSRSVTVSTDGGTSNAALFTVNPGTPTLTSVAPVSAVVGATVPVTLTGTFLSGATINPVAGVTITVTNTTATQVNASFVVAPGATIGPRSVTVTTVAGTSNAVTWTVDATAPTLTSLAPNAGNTGVTVPVVLTGTNLTGATIDTIAGVTVTVTNVTATQINAGFAIAANAAGGPRNVTVTTAGGPSNAAVFTVGVAAPTLTGIAPVSGIVGATVPVVLTGTNLTGATINAIAGVTVTVTNTTATQINASFVVAANAATGARNVTVTTAGGTSNAVTWTVDAAPPTLTTIAPNAGNTGATIPVVLTGTNLTGATINAIAGVTVTVTNTTATQINASFAIAANAATGPRNVTVTTAGGTSSAAVFTVTFGIVPTLASISPATGVAGTSVPVDLTGTSFTGATSINVTGLTGITVTNLSVISSTQITATFVIATAATQGSGSITVTTPGGNTNAVSFTVLPPAPVITSLNNTSISKRSINVGMNVNGSNLGNLPIGSFQVLLNGAPVNPASVNITNFTPSQTQIRFNWTFLAAAPITDATHAYTVTVTTPGGTSNAFPFTVTN